MKKGDIVECIDVKVLTEFYDTGTDDIQEDKIVIGRRYVIDRVSKSGNGVQLEEGDYFHLPANFKIIQQ